MTAITPYAIMVETLLAANAAPEVIVRAIEAVELDSKERRASGKGKRLAAGWQPSESCIAYALDRGMSRARIDIESERFRNYWLAKSGSGATKRDWSATWRNWVITALERGYGPPSYRGQGSGSDSTSRRAPTGSDAIVAGMGRLARRVDERRISEIGDGRPVPHDSHTSGELDLVPKRTR